MAVFHRTLRVTRLDFDCTHDPRPDFHSRYTKIDCPRLQIPVCHTTEPKHRPFADRDPGPNSAARGDPCPFVNADRTHYEIKRRARPVVVTGAKIGTLRDAAVRSD